jgi:rubredoxin
MAHKYLRMYTFFLYSTCIWHILLNQCSICFWVYPREDAAKKHGFKPNHWNWLVWHVICPATLRIHIFLNAFVWLHHFWRTRNVVTCHCISPLPRKVMIFCVIQLVLMGTPFCAPLPTCSWLIAGWSWLRTSWSTGRTSPAAPVTSEFCGFWGATSGLGHRVPPWWVYPPVSSAPWLFDDVPSYKGYIYSIYTLPFRSSCSISNHFGPCGFLWKEDIPNSYPLISTKPY